MTLRILVASDGTDGSRGALRWARKLQERDGSPVEVISAVEPLPLYDAGFGVAVPADVLEAHGGGVEARLREQIAQDVGDVGWPLTIAHGGAASAIVAHADRADADLIVVGLGRHGPMDRLFGTETALKVVRLAHRPVLAVPPDGEALPRTAVAAVDFTRFSRDAAAAASRVLSPPATLHLLHAMSGLEILPGGDDAWREDYEAFVTSRLERFRGELDAADGIDLVVHVVDGDAAEAVLDFAESANADLVAAGSHGHSFVGRVLLGSVSTKLIRGAHGGVLVSPPPEPAELDSAPREVRAESSPHPWVAEMQTFTERNAGRRTILEIDDPELGAQYSGRNFPLRGVDYDPRADRVEIMLGRLHTVEGHLTHSIPGPTALDVIRGEGGGDEALHVGLRSGQMILRILDE